MVNLQVVVLKITLSDWWKRESLSFEWEKRNEHWYMTINEETDSFGCLINTWKEAQHCLLLEKRKSKLQWDISHHSEWPSSKSVQTTNAGDGVEKREISCTVGEKCKLIQPLWRTVWTYLKKLGIKLSYDPVIPLLGIYPEETIIEKDTCTPKVHCSSVYNS